MSRHLQLFIMLLLSSASICFAQNKKNDIKESELYGKWEWTKVISYSAKGEPITQSEYMPGRDTKNIKVFNADKTMSDIMMGVGTKNFVTKGTWSLKRDTLIITLGSRIIVTTYNIDKSVLKIKYVKVTDINYLKDYSSKKDKTTEEYIKRRN